MPKQQTSFLTDAITECVDEIMEILSELFEEEDMGLGILEFKVPQDILRQRFTEIATAVTLDEHMQLSDGFIQDFGEQELQRQTQLAVTRKRGTNGT